MPKSARNTSAIAPLAALKRGFWKKCMSSIGWLEWTSHTKNAPSSTTPTANPARIGAELQPFVGASMIAQRIEPSETTESSAPIGSRRPCDGSRDSGTNR